MGSQWYGSTGNPNSYWPPGSRKVMDAGRSSQCWNWEILHWIGNSLLQNSWALIGSHGLWSSLRWRRCSEWNSCCCCLGLISCRTLLPDIHWKDEVFLCYIKRWLEFHNVEGLFESQAASVSALANDFG